MQRAVERSGVAPAGKGPLQVYDMSLLQQCLALLGTGRTLPLLCEDF